MIASPLQIIMSLFAINLSRSAFLFAINVSQNLPYLQAGAFMFASHNNYLADEIKGTYRGMMIAIPPEEWCVFQTMTFTELSQTLKHLASLVKLRTFRRHPRDPKKAQPKRTYLKNKPHVSTAKILNQKTLQNNTP